MTSSQALHWYKRLRTVMQVTFARTTGEVETLEGPVKCEAGDAIVTGVEGECWPVQRQRFQTTYEVADNNIEMFQDGAYRRKPISVQAKQLTEPTTVTLSGSRGALSAQTGDWLLFGPEGDRWVVADSVFRMTYEAKHTTSVEEI